jgi:cell division protein ZapA (FtsZ GTPase activity inhibitor)
LTPDEHIPVRIELVNRSFQLRVPRKEEEYVRAAAHFMQSKLQKFSNQYASGDDLNSMVYVTLDVATDLIKLHQGLDQRDDSLERVVTEIEQMLNIA